MSRRSRYQDALAFTGADGGEPIFRGFRPREIAPATGVIEHTVSAGERLDALARHYYNDDRLWWRIVDANPEALYGDDLVRESASELRPSMIGRVIRIPKARE
jgi:nucleoid-associated protein YgaU